MDLPITDSGIRPAGTTDKCFYCGWKVSQFGIYHAPDCVLVRKSIVLRMAIDYVVEVPQSWTEEDITFFYNESTHCADNEFNQIADEIEGDEHCLCHRSTNTYLRDATEADHETLNWKGPRE
jgi:hypothetical protein